DGGSDGIPAVGDFDGDGLPEVVRTASGTVILSDTDGTFLWSTSIPGGGSGGPPTVADFDGDGEPEVGVAAYDYYTVYETDGTVLWSNPVEDHSSSVTGSSVFDFEGDGAAEVVYADEYTLWVFEGATGAVLVEQTGHASGTLYEYPLIADVDRDDSTEIVVASNDYTKSGWNGITVIGDEDSSWAPARPIWNQFAYHITNVDNDGSIPTTQVVNWESWNNFRAGGTELGPSHWLPDLAPGEADYCLDDCDEGSVLVYLAVENGGLLESSGFEVSLYPSGGSDPVASESVTGLGSGESIIVGPFTLDAAAWGSGRLVATVDEPQAVEECDEEDNERLLATWPCD
ncbi:MAG: FG-GAP-like repeat-containing protein, partial [Myxococcota bacterium]|nr:FG-GAP-like repeat-containing protein [Myxococcota bacterium]